MAAKGTIRGPVQPGPRSHNRLHPLENGALKLDGGFWGERQQLNRDVTIPHGMQMLEEWGSLDNLRSAAGRALREYQLPLFMDSDVYKLLEAIAWERQHGPAEEQERFYADTAGLLAAVQEPDGYLNSYVQVVQSGKRFADPAMGHEMYCAGHLVQAAVAEARGGGTPAGAPLGDLASRFAAYLLEAVPAMPGFVNGHPEIEMALVELYRERGDKGLLRLAEDFVGRRGRSTLKWGSFHADYFQDDVPVVDTTFIRGHAVRALYLLSGVADLYSETGRPELLHSCLSQWDDMVAGKTYLTGGIGSRHESESFGTQFELPSDRAYCETCAAVASIMWNWRMCLITGQARFAELLERTLYNAFLPGWGLDGKSFFYVNPLQSRGGVARQGWYRCACCPPNIMRLVASLEHYVASRTDDSLQLHQFMPATINVPIAGGRLRARVGTAYPHQGELRVTVDEAPPGEMELAIRLPSWAAHWQVGVDGAHHTGATGAHHAGATGDDGYVRLRRIWRAGEELWVRFPFDVRITRPDPRIDPLRGSFALERGPLVYCVESPGGASGAMAPGPMQLDRVAAVPEVAGERPSRIGQEPIVALSLEGRQLSLIGAGWPYHSEPSAAQEEPRSVVLTAIPYYSWANRGKPEMRIWLPEMVPGRQDGAGPPA